MAVATVILCAISVIHFNVAHAQSDPAFACLSEPGPIEVVDGYHNSGSFKPSVAAGKKFDARMASFEYPETLSYAMVYLGARGGAGADDMCWAGGYFTASTSWHDLDISWRDSKQGYDDTDYGRGKMNNTTSVESYENHMVWSGLHVYNMHDGIRANNSYNNWTVQHVWMDYIRDDCIENDRIYSGTVYDSLFDGCYTGFSARPGRSDKGGGQSIGQSITIDKVLLRMEPMPYPYKWDVKNYPVVNVDGYGGVPFGHGRVFKLDSNNEPEFAVTNSVFLHEYDVGGRIFPPKGKVTACENNTIIWLAGRETAPTYLLDEIPGCFTLIVDKDEGKAYWKSKVADWHARHTGVGANRKPAVPGEYTWPRYPAPGAKAD